MIFSKSSVGIEISGNDLRLAVTRSHLRKLQLIAVHRISGFMTLNEEERQKAVRTLVKKSHIPAVRVYLTLPRDQGVVRQVELPAEMTEKLADVVNLQIETLSPWALDEIYWTFAEDRQKKNGKRIMVTIAIIPRTSLDPWITFFNAVGISLAGATLSSLAYGHGIATLWKQDRATLVLHGEQTYTEGVLVKGSRIAALTAPSSGDAIERESFVGRLLSIAKLPSAEDCRLVFCGGAFDAAVPEENPVVPIENAGRQSTNDFGPIATALLPLKASPFKSNLIPPALRYRENQLRLIPAYILGFLAIAISLGLVVRGPYQNMVYASRLDTEIRRIAPLVSEVANQENDLNQLSARLRALTSQLQNRERNLEALRELARILPASTFLSNYAYQDGAITVAGFTQSASEIQNLLENSPLFKGVEFTNSVIRDASGKDRFTLKMTIEASQ